MHSRTLAIIVGLLTVALSDHARADEPFPAHRVIGNLYYVGSRQLASYLITTPAGHVLINSSFEETVPLIRVAVESLGFKVRDVSLVPAKWSKNEDCSACTNQPIGGR